MIEMVYALEMFFDPNTEQKVMKYFTDIKESGINSYLVDVDSRPHITVGCFNDIDVPRANDALKNYCKKLEKFTVGFSSLGIFTYPKFCVFLSPVNTKELLILHKDMHKTFDFCTAEGFEYYLPGSWVPHCAVDITDDINVMRRSSDYLLNNFKPFEAEVTNVGWVETTQPVKRLERFYLR